MFWKKRNRFGLTEDEVKDLQAAGLVVVAAALGVMVARRLFRMKTVVVKTQTAGDLATLEEMARMAQVQDVAHKIVAQAERQKAAEAATTAAAQ